MSRPFSGWTEADLTQAKLRMRSAVPVQVATTEKVSRGPDKDFGYKIELVLLGKMPSGKNAIHITRTGKHLANDRFIVWRKQALDQIARQWQSLTITTPVRLHCDYWPGDEKTRDVSGMTDALFHLLVKAKVLKDDGLVHDLLWYRQSMNKKFPKLCFTILVL